ncbi:MAG: ATP-binding protein [Ilumatobacter sp.]|uniref:sensor histidine kinase n=1 Tax=Ilumatobacter sp. TaxID=1967498 RepID=UPI002628D455|nr:ATP-binding protein [Ilumatobacter sp.]MDJ0771788.1 ATP-binding protein [Ilumatobacter sp.]
MRLSLRLTIVFGILGLFTIPTVAALAWVFASQEVRGSIDDQLLDQADRIEALSNRDFNAAVQDVPVFNPVLRDQTLAEGSPPPTRPVLGNDDGGVRLYDADGEQVNEGDDILTDTIAARLAGGESGFLETVESEGRTLRVITISIDGFVPVPDSDAEIATLQLYADVTADEDALSGLAVRLFGASLLGVGVVGVGSWFVGRWLAKPLGRVTDAAEHFAELDDLPGRIEISRNDEIGRLADSFNRMLSGLEVAREQQRRLVADASHELRTPLTSVRMRTEFLARHDDLDPARRQALLDAAVVDVEQLSALVSDLVDLAADLRSDDEEPQTVRLAAVVDAVAQRAGSATGREIRVESDETEARVRPGMVRRAVQNLVDNAVKYSPEGEPIDICARQGRIEVVDRGPGIAAEDAGHVFDRFYRSPKARSRPGNGIGLAIVQQVADAHGGETWVGESPTGGARVGFSVAV